MSSRRRAAGTRTRAARIYSFKRAGARVPPGRRARSRSRWPGSPGAGVPFVHEDARPFFRDVTDHLTRASTSRSRVSTGCSPTSSRRIWRRWACGRTTTCGRSRPGRRWSRCPTTIAGVYGMNFDHMPELRSVWGYPAVVGLMAVVVLGLYRLFKRRGWL